MFGKFFGSYRSDSDIIRAADAAVVIIFSQVNLEWFFRLNVNMPPFLKTMADKETKKK